MNAGEAMAAAAAEALRALPALTGVHEARPTQAAPPHAIVEAGLEADWGHKSGRGRELRLTVTLRDEGERPVRLRALAAAAQAVLDGIETVEGWQLVTLVFVRGLTVAEGTGKWLTMLDYRARLLEETV
jgi:Protein of unknown function (DUF3168)